MISKCHSLWRLFLNNCWNKSDLKITLLSHMKGLFNMFDCICLSSFLLYLDFPSSHLFPPPTSPFFLLTFIFPVFETNKFYRYWSYYWVDLKNNMAQVNIIDLNKNSMILLECNVNGNITILKFNISYIKCYMNLIQQDILKLYSTR